MTKGTEQISDGKVVAMPGTTTNPASGQPAFERPIVGGTGGGGGGGMLDSRVARLESDVEYIKRDVGEIKSDIKALAGRVDTINTRLAYGTGAIVAGAAILGLVISIGMYVITNNFQVALEVIQKSQ